MRARNGLAIVAFFGLLGCALGNVFAGGLDPLQRSQTIRLLNELGITTGGVWTSVAQTPWTGNVNAATYNLTGVGTFTTTGNSVLGDPTGDTIDTSGCTNPQQFGGDACFPIDRKLCFYSANNNLNAPSSSKIDMNCGAAQFCRFNSDQASLNLSRGHPVSYSSGAISAAPASQACGDTLTLTDAVAKNVLEIACVQSSALGGEIVATVTVQTATTFQVVEQEVHFSCVNIGGTFTTQIKYPAAGPSADGSEVLPSGTLAVTWAAAEGTADYLRVTCTADTSLTPTAMTLRYHVILDAPGAVTIPSP